MSLPGILSFTTNTCVAMAFHKNSLAIQPKKTRKMTRMTSMGSENYSVVSINTKASPSSMPRLLETGDFSDCTVVAGQREFRLHKNVICYQSDFFMKAFTVPMIEASTSRVELKEPAENLDDIGRMIKFMYEAEYRRPSELADLATISSAGRPPTRPEILQKVLDGIWLDIRMYSLAKKYMVNKLMDFALAAFLENIQSELLFPIHGARAMTGVIHFIKNDPATVGSIIDLARRTFNEGDDLSPAHADGVFNLVYQIFPCLSKFAEFREALSGDLSKLAARILWRGTPTRAEKMVENCTMCNADLIEEAAMEFVSFCHGCKVKRRVDDVAADPSSFNLPWSRDH